MTRIIHRYAEREQAHAKLREAVAQPETIAAFMRWPEEGEHFWQTVVYLPVLSLDEAAGIVVTASDEVLRAAADKEDL